MSLRHLIYLLVFILAVAIQWPLWFGKGGVLRMQALEAELASVRAANDRLRAENDAILVGRVTDELEHPQLKASAPACVWV